MSTEREIPYVDVAGHAVTLRAMAANLRSGKPGDPECWAVLFDKYAGVIDRLRAQVAAADDLAAACAIFVPSGAYGAAVMDRLARLTSIQQADAFVKIRAQLEAYLARRRSNYEPI